MKRTPTDGHDISPETLLEISKFKFEKTKNPVHLLEAFLIVYRSKKTLPKWIFNHMGKIFEDFYEAEGGKSLDVLFGFKPGKGQEPPFKRLLEESRDERIFLDVYLLRGLFGFSIEEAAYMVEQRYQERPVFYLINMCRRRLDPKPDGKRSRFRIKPIAAATIQSRYIGSSWRKLFEREPIKKEILGKISSRTRIEYLKLFPEDSFPRDPQGDLKFPIPASKK